MSKLHIRPRVDDASASQVKVTPETAGWQFVGFEYLQFSASEVLEILEPDKEVCVVMLSGTFDVLSATLDEKGLVGRTSVFNRENPVSVYITPNERVKLTFSTNAEVAICSAPASGEYASRVIMPEDCTNEERGFGNNKRYIVNILPEQADAEKLLVVEVITPSGNWSSYPPHKHDEDSLPNESYLEETYFHKLNPSQGFAFQRVYTDDRSIDETICVENNSLVMVPRGYHPVGVPHGYESYYLNVMAGPKRVWRFKNDPAHEWIMNKR